MQAGLIYTPDYKYDPRWYYGNDGTIKVVSLAATEAILPGYLIQALPDGTCRVARDLTRLVGISVYDPNRHDPGVAYGQFEMVPILRRGTVWAAFSSLAQPVMLDKARVNPDGTFTADLTGLIVPHCQWDTVSSLGVFSSSDTDGTAVLLSANFG